MHPVEVLRFLGGTARRADLLRRTTARALAAAVQAHEVERVGYGRYALPGLPSALKVASALSGVVSHESAAEYWCLERIAAPISTHVTVPPQAHRRAQKGVTLHYGVLPAGEGAVTSPVRTVIDCARTMPFREALAIADSALRTALITREELLEAASAVTGPGCRRVRRVAAHATPLAANPLESALRAAAVEAGLSNLVPQLLISEDGLNYYVDLGDEKARIAAEADSFTYHGTPEALARDCRRYDELVTRGWLLLRFSHDQTIFDDRWVKEKLIDAYRVQASHFGGSKRSRTRKHPPPGN